MDDARRAGDAPGPVLWRPLPAISRDLSCAVLLAEDGAFFQYGALERERLQQLFNALMLGDFSRGYSGIGQQLARNLYLSGNRSPRRKARELALAVALHHAVSKERAFELYMNLVEWGEGSWGAGSASVRHFGVPSESLGPSRAILLASMLPAPRRAAYVLSAAATKRQDALVERMRRTRIFTDEVAGETRERLRAWRAHVRRGRSFRGAMAAVDSLMGTERSAARGDLPLGVQCDPQRW